MSSRIYSFSTIQNVSRQYELCKGLQGPKGTEVAILSQLVIKMLRKGIRRFRE